MGNIMDIPPARWAGPEDSLYDKHYNEYELWVNDLFEIEEQYAMGFFGNFDEALGCDWLFDVFMDELNRSKEI